MHYQISHDWKFYILNQISLRFVANGPIDNDSVYTDYRQVSNISHTLVGN